VGVAAALSVFALAGPVQAPEGVRVQRVARGVPHPSNLAFDPRRRLWVTSRQPSVVECSVSCVRGSGRSGLSRTHGARLIDSTPPATHSSPSPAASARLAWIAASIPEPHRRVTVAPGRETGSPASSTAILATLRLSSPAWFASPKKTSSIRSGSTPVRSTSSRSARAARSSGRTPASAPP